MDVHVIVVFIEKTCVLLDVRPRSGPRAMKEEPPLRGLTHSFSGRCCVGPWHQRRCLRTHPRILCVFVRRYGIQHDQQGDKTKS